MPRESNIFTEILPKEFFVIANLAARDILRHDCKKHSMSLAVFGSVKHSMSLAVFGSHKRLLSIKMKDKNINILNFLE